jgi:hypothetical protein
MNINWRSNYADWTKDGDWWYSNDKQRAYKGGWDPRTGPYGEGIQLLKLKDDHGKIQRIQVRTFWEAGIPTGQALIHKIGQSVVARGRFDRGDLCLKKSIKVICKTNSAENQFETYEVSVETDRLNAEKKRSNDNTNKNDRNVDIEKPVIDIEKDFIWTGKEYEDHEKVAALRSLRKMDEARQVNFQVQANVNNEIGDYNHFIDRPIKHSENALKLNLPIKKEQNTKVSIPQSPSIQNQAFKHNANHFNNTQAYPDQIHQNQAAPIYYASMNGYYDPYLINQNQAFGLVYCSPVNVYSPYYPYWAPQNQGVAAPSYYSPVNDYNNYNGSAVYNNVFVSFGRSSQTINVNPEMSNTSINNNNAYFEIEPLEKMSSQPSTTDSCDSQANNSKNTIDQVPQAIEGLEKILSLEKAKGSEIFWDLDLK